MIDIKQGDCLELMKALPNESVDLILCDLPYGTTACSWDTIIPLDKLWEQYIRIIKNEGTIALTASQPFTSILVSSNIKMFKYEWIWEKAVGSNFAVLKYQPMKEHESILIFAKGRNNYYPIKEQRKGSGAERIKMPFLENSVKGGEVYSKIERNNAGKEYTELRYPSSVQFFNNRETRNRDTNPSHPTQKPVALMEYLINTYTKEGELVLDNCMGSGTTGVACINTKRNFIGFELDQEYFNIAKKRIEDATKQVSL